jgi:hypothetical protein
VVALDLTRIGIEVALDPRSGDHGADPVVVELEQIVGRCLEPPLRARRGSA